MENKIEITKIVKSAEQQLNDLKQQFAKLDTECDELAQSSALAAVAAERAIKQRNRCEKLYAQKCDEMGEIKAKINATKKAIANEQK